MGRRLLEIVVYDKRCRIGGKLTLDDLAETSEIGDWKMPDFKAACAYAVTQGWLIVEDDTLTRSGAGGGLKKLGFAVAVHQSCLAGDPPTGRPDRFWRGDAR